MKIQIDRMFKFLHLIAIFLGVLVTLVGVIIGFFLNIIPPKETLIGVTFFGICTASLILLYDTNPLGKIFTKQSVEISPKKAKWMILFALLIALPALYDGIFIEEQANNRFFAIVFGVTFVLFSLFGIIQLIRKKAK